MRTRELRVVHTCRHDKETLMTTSRLGLIDRRMAIGGALAGVAGLALPRRQSRIVTQRGIVGGGVVQFEQGEASFSLFVSRLIFAEDEVVVVGSVLWTDETHELTLRSTVITAYVVPEVQPEQGALRRVFGTMRDDAGGEYPFELELTDVDLPGSGADTVVLKVGNGARTSDTATPVSELGFTYMASGTLATGDIQLIGIEVDPAAGVARPAPN
jgi:hypothetical protein